MCVLSKYFKMEPDIEKMSESQLHKYIDKLDKKISEETIASKFSNQTEDAQENLYKKIEIRDRALHVLQKKIDESKRR